MLLYGITLSSNGTKFTIKRKLTIIKENMVRKRSYIETAYDEKHHT